jgi:hypothetical protein
MKMNIDTQGTKHISYTKDMTIKFYEKSFRVDGMAAVIWTGRRMIETDYDHIASTLQNMVDKVRNEKTNVIRTFNHRNVEELATIQNDWLITENEQLKDEVEDLKSDIAFFWGDNP